MGEMASFYKCALQVNSFTYAKYRGKKPDEEEHYNQNILKHSHITCPPSFCESVQLHFSYAC